MWRSPGQRGSGSAPGQAAVPGTGRGGGGGAPVPARAPVTTATGGRRLSQWARTLRRGPRAAAAANGRGPWRAARGLRGNRTAAAAAAPLVPPAARRRGRGLGGRGGAWRGRAARGEAPLVSPGGAAWPPRGQRGPRSPHPPSAPL